MQLLSRSTITPGALQMTALFDGINCVKFEIWLQKYKSVWLEVVFPLELLSTEENTLKI